LSEINDDDDGEEEAVCSLPENFRVFNNKNVF